MSKVKILFYIDERYGFKANPRHYFVSGISLVDSEKHKIVDFVRQFKKSLRPELNPDEWFLKGSGEWIYNNQKYRETFEEACKRWLL